MYSVRKRLEDALMADMLAQVEDTGDDDKTPKDEIDSSDEMDTV